MSDEDVPVILPTHLGFRIFAGECFPILDGSNLTWMRLERAEAVRLYHSIGSVLVDDEKKAEV